MKRFICIILSIAFAFSLSACGGSSDKKASSSSGNGTAPESSGSSESNTVSADGKTLVVYFSATGSTKRVAETIAGVLNADIFEIVPETPYSSGDLNWSDKESRVSKEHDDESLRNVALKSSVPDNWERYDTVYIGYPIWWGIAAWPVDSFVSANDFSDKTVIPFCTSASSVLGNSAELLKNKAGAGSWGSGKRFSSSVGEAEIREWLDKS